MIIPRAAASLSARKPAARTAQGHGKACFHGLFEAQDEKNRIKYG
jgi:hypothetical protein